MSGGTFDYADRHAKIAVIDGINDFLDTAPDEKPEVRAALADVRHIAEVFFDMLHDVDYYIASDIGAVTLLTGIREGKEKLREMLRCTKQ
jgi:hypothetical protein